MFMPTKFLNKQPKPHPCCLSSLPRFYLSGCCRNYISKGIGSSHHKHFRTDHKHLEMLKNIHIYKKINILFLVHLFPHFPCPTPNIHSLLPPKNPTVPPILVIDLSPKAQYALHKITNLKHIECISKAEKNPSVSWFTQHRSASNKPFSKSGHL